MAETSQGKKGMPGAVRIALMLGAGLFGLVGLGAAGVVLASNAAMNKTYDIQPVPLEVKPTPDLIARGKEIATFRGCTDCHGEDLAGRVVADAMPVMKLVGPNITPGGVTRKYSDEDWARSIRHGVKPSGLPLLFMPSYEWTELSHYDLAAIIAFARSVPTKTTDAGQFEVGPVGRLLYLAGELPLIPAEKMNHDLKPVAPQRGPTQEYGKYLASGCIGCHGDGLSGGPIPGGDPSWPAAANLTAHETGLKDWSAEDFAKFFRTGKRPDGTEVHASMPVKAVSESSTDDDLRAIYEYLRSVPPKAAGGR